MGLTMWFVHVVFAAALLFGAVYGLTLVGLKAGFALDAATLGLAVVGSSLALLLLWPVWWLLRKLRFRGRPMPPVRPDIEVPRALSFGVQAVFVLALVALVGLVALTGFLHLALLGYGPVDEWRETVVGQVQFTRQSKQGLPVLRVDVSGPRLPPFSLDEQSSELWVLEGRRFSVLPWAKPVLGRLRVVDAFRVVGVSKKQDQASPAVSAGDVGGRSVVEGMLMSVAPWLPGMKLETVESPPAKPGEAGGAYVLRYSGGGLRLEREGGAGATAGTTGAPASPAPAPTSAPSPAPATVATTDEGEPE